MGEVLRVAELCAGYGGLFLAMRRAGWPVELAWVAETDADASKVLAVHHPAVPNVGDIATAQFSAQEPVDVIAAGYPCQPFSFAGKRKGTDDDRWIWPDVARAVRILRPRLVVLENVPGHLAWGFPEVVGGLAALGFVGSWTCVRASDIGACHRRDRLFAVAADSDRIGLHPGRHDAGQPEIAEPVDRYPPTLMPTPTARDGMSGPGHADSAEGTPDLRTAVSLLPTPRASDGDSGGPNQRSNHGALALKSAVQPARFGPYEAAVRRWERTQGRPAPEPTEPGAKGQPRLSAQFVEWMQGLPLGYVTAHVGRNAALRILGNGVVPAQGAHALSLLLPGSIRPQLVGVACV